MRGLSHTTWRRVRSLVGAGAAVAALAVSAAPASAARHGDVVRGHKIGAQRAGQRAPRNGRKVGSDRAGQRAPLFGRKVSSVHLERGWFFHGHKIG
jgi:hypothetical protein